MTQHRSRLFLICLVMSFAACLGEGDQQISSEALPNNIAGDQQVGGQPVLPPNNENPQSPDVDATDNQQEVSDTAETNELTGVGATADVDDFPIASDKAVFLTDADRLIAGQPFSAAIVFEPRDAFEYPKASLSLNNITVVDAKQADILNNNVGNNIQTPNDILNGNVPLLPQTPQPNCSGIAWESANHNYAYLTETSAVKIEQMERMPTDVPLGKRGTGIYHDLSRSDFEWVLAHAKQQRYRPIQINVTQDERYSVIVRQNLENIGWVVRTALTAMEFSNLSGDLKEYGYRLIDQSVRKACGQDYYGGIWIGDGYESLSSLGMTYQSWQQNITNMQTNYLPIDIEVYHTASGLRYNMLWAKKTPPTTNELLWKIEFIDLPIKQSGGLNIKQAAYYQQGYSLYDLASFFNPQTDGYQLATLWLKSNKKTLANSDFMITQANVTFENYANGLYDAGYRPDSMTTYKLGQQTVYAFNWIENDWDRTRWQHKNEVNNYLFGDGVQPGMVFEDAYATTGGAIGVLEKGKIVYLRGYGKRDAFWDLNADAHTRFRIASMSKFVTGVLGLKLNEIDSEFDLETEVRNIYLPELPGMYDDISLKLLYGHGSGIRHFLSDDDPLVTYDGELVVSGWQAVTTFMNDPLQPVPVFLYSNPGYQVIQAAMESHFGKHYCSLLKQYIGQPLGIKLQCEIKSQDVVGRSRYYKRFLAEDHAVREVNTTNLTTISAGGGLEVSVEDFLKFFQALTSNRIISDYTQLNKKLNGTYGYGIWIKEHYNTTRWQHTGLLPGTRSCFYGYPEEQSVIVVFLNRLDFNADGLTQNVDVCGLVAGISGIMH